MFSEGSWTKALYWVWLFWLVMGVSGCGTVTEVSSQSQPVELVIFAATSLTEAFSEIGNAFEQQHAGVRVTLNFANANTLLQQIAQGAPADIFASAAPRFIEDAVTQGLIEKDAVKVFARNRLVIILPRGNPQGITTMQDLARPGVRLILGAKEGPQGLYVEQLLTNASASPDFMPDFKEKVYQNVVSYESTVKGVVNKIVLGEGDAGIVFLTDGKSAEGQIQLMPIPEAVNVEAVYPIAVLKSAPHGDEARDFMNFVLSDEGQKILQKYGFLPSDGMP